MTTLIIRHGFRDIGKVILKNGVVTGTEVNPGHKEPDPLRGMKGFIEKSVYEYAVSCGWKVLAALPEDNT
jgi:hypothetical protein